MHIKKLYSKTLPILLLLPTMAFASSSTKLDDVLQNLLDYLTSTPARIIALLAIAGAGYATFHLGKLPKDKFIAIVIGIGVLFGGSTILSMLGI